MLSQSKLRIAAIGGVVFFLNFVPAPLEGRTMNAPLADGFDCPVGKPDGAGYYVYRGFRPNGHLGEDWNGNGKGNTDLGDPVYSTADGVVVLSTDVRMGWGNVVIIRHAYRDADGVVRLVDSLYGHLDQRIVRKDQIVRRGQQVGTIGTAHGIYTAHLHFEMRKNLEVGMNRSKFPRDFSVYYSPRIFVTAHRRLLAGRSYAVAVDTFGPSQSPVGPQVAGGKQPERHIPTRDAVASREISAQKKVEMLNKLIEQNKRTTEAMTDQEVDRFWDRLKQKLKDGKVTSGESHPKR